MKFTRTIHSPRMVHHSNLPCLWHPQAKSETSHTRPEDWQINVTFTKHVHAVLMMHTAELMNLWYFSSTTLRTSFTFYLHYCNGGFFVGFLKSLLTTRRNIPLIFINDKYLHIQPPHPAGQINSPSLRTRLNVRIELQRKEWNMFLNLTPDG